MRTKNVFKPLIFYLFLKKLIPYQNRIDGIIFFAMVSFVFIEGFGKVFLNLIKRTHLYKRAYLLESGKVLVVL